MKKLFLLLIAIALYPGFLLKAQTIQLTPVITGLDNPLGVENCGDSRLFIVLQGGKIMVADSDYAVAPLPFLNISNIITSGGETGLLGLAFHPDYKNNGYFYITYNRYVGPQLQDVVARYNVSAVDSNRADSLSGEILITINDPFTNHNGGSIKFGTDGYLYIGFGDGGDRNDPFENGQNVNTILGKIIRIDVDNGSPYAIPADNPFVGLAGHREEIWSYGLRNPWRFSFDRLTGDLWIGDVGQNKWEEIDFQPVGAEGGRNYGWLCYEANQQTNLASNCPPDSVFTFPVYAYSHDFNNDCSITGGYVYRGTKNSSLEGKYIFTDYCNGLIRAFNPQDSSVVNLYDGDNETMSSFGEDNNGELYLCEVAHKLVLRLDKIFTGIKSIDEGGYTISPNPAYNEIVITTNDNVHIERVEVHNLTGQTLSSVTYKDKNNTHLVSLAAPAGIYFIHISTEKGDYVEKLIKQ